MKWDNVHFADQDCVLVKNRRLSLWITHSVGPRIIGLSIDDSDNMLAVLPEAATTTPAGEVYRFYGGHRLWHAPEDIERTYVADDEPVIITAVSPHTLSFTSPTEELTGIQKSIAITLPDDSAVVVIDHALTNQGDAPVQLAPWAITQLKPGGFAILPMSQAESGLLPNRRLSLWPYTAVNSPYLQWGDQFVFVHATMKADKLKVGWANPEGWMGYYIDNILFVKQAVYQQDAEYFDFGSSSECYCDARCLELETVGAKTMLEPGESVSHQEKWQLHANIVLDAEETAVSNISHLFTNR